MTMTKIKHSYKDSLFRYLFQEKEELILLCNAVCGTKYPLDTPLEITTLEDVIYIGIKNDISFILDLNMHLFEHQSTLTPNLPLRGVFYFAQLYRKYVEKYALNVYGSKRLLLPLPRYLIFCNDEHMQEDKVVYRLSESFGSNDNSALECVAEVININADNNTSIMKGCKKLQEYASFVSAVRNEQKAGFCVEEAIDRAVSKCIDDGILSELLSVHRAEVKDMVLEEYDYHKHMELERRDARAEGLEEGKTLGLAEGKNLGLAEGKNLGLAEGKNLGLAEGKNLGLAEGKSLGLTEGRIAEAQRINQLILLLLSNSRESDIAKMACDKVFQEQLFLEFGL